MAGTAVPAAQMLDVHRMLIEREATLAERDAELRAAYARIRELENLLAAAAWRDVS